LQSFGLFINFLTIYFNYFRPTLGLFSNISRPNTPYFRPISFSTNNLAHYSTLNTSPLQQQFLNTTQFKRNPFQQCNQRSKHTYNNTTSDPTLFSFFLNARTKIQDAANPEIADSSRNRGEPRNEQQSSAVNPTKSRKSSILIQKRT